MSGFLYAHPNRGSHVYRYMVFVGGFGMPYAV